MINLQFNLDNNDFPTLSRGMRDFQVRTPTSPTVTAPGRPPSISDTGLRFKINFLTNELSPQAETLHTIRNSLDEYIVKVSAKLNE